MLTPARVLLIGNDLPHMSVRAAVLEHFWQVSSMLDTEVATTEQTADLVVILETIPETSRQALVEQVKQQDSSLIVVKINGFDSGPYASADAIVDAERGPGALVSAVYELLTERGLGSRSWPIPGS